MGRSAETRVSARARSETTARLRARRPEIEEAILARATAVADTPLVRDVDYMQGLRAAITAAVGFGLAGIEGGEECCDSPPPAVLAQARHASRRRVGLQVVLRRYAVGYSALSDFLMQEMGGGGPGASPSGLYPLQRELTAVFDRLVQAVSDAYEDEARHLAPAQRHARRVRRLLDGELIDTAELDYDFDAWHLAVLAPGPGGEEILREAAADLDRRLLLWVEEGEGVVCGWIGGRRAFDREQIGALASRAGPPRAPMAIGTPARGLRGWRLTYRQAKAALSVGSHRPPGLTRYEDVALLAAILRDGDLIEFLTSTYLAPLTVERDGGELLRATLRAYFSAARNISSAAAALGVTRKTVDNRLRIVESHVGGHISSIAAELEIVLCIDQLRRGASAGRPPGHSHIA